MRPRERKLFSAFASLAGDRAMGLMAFIIWRSRSDLLSWFKTTSENRLEGSEPGASHAHSCWQMERVAGDDLPHRRRPVQP
ncbi:MAG: hypothetical protein IH859_08075 [Chloroflexi bacterium]|nr:hypothetical protein [Chloroflexota bacterium]